MDRPLKVLLVDDHDMIRAGLRRLLTDAGGIAVVGEAADGAAAVRMAAELAPDVVVMDLSMPEIDGIAATRAIVSRPGAEEPPPKVVALSSVVDEGCRAAALAAGAVAFVAKHAAFEELRDALREAAAGRTYVSPSATGARPAAARLVPALHNPDLSRRERETLELLLAGDSVKQVARKLGLSNHTIHLYVAGIYRKFDVHTRAELLSKALGQNEG